MNIAMLYHTDRQRGSKTIWTVFLKLLHELSRRAEKQGAKLRNAWSKFAFNDVDKRMGDEMT